MMKTWKELNMEYVPENKSTNFSNNTCRRRLLDKFIGEGKWSYVYEGNKAVAVEIVTETEEVVEEEVIETEEPVVEEMEEQEVVEIRTEADCDAEIARCENDIVKLQEDIVKLQDRIEYMRNKKIEVCDVRKAFSGIKFTKYANFNDIQAVYTEALRRYEMQKGKAGIDKEFEKVQMKFLKQIDKHLKSSTWNGFSFTYDYSKGRRIKFEGKLPDVYEWVECYKQVWNKHSNFSGELYSRYTTPESLLDKVEEFEWKFRPVSDKSSSCREYICRLQFVLNQCQAVQSDPMYVKISNLVSDMETYIIDVDIFTRKGEELFEEFKNGWTTYFNRRKSQQDNEKKEQERKQRGQSRNRTYSSFSSYFNGCNTERELKKKHREWCMKLHPDRGGDVEHFRAMQEEYELLREKFRSNSSYAF